MPLGATNLPELEALAGPVAAKLATVWLLGFEATEEGPIIAGDDSWPATEHAAATPDVADATDQAEPTGETAGGVGIWVAPGVGFGCKAAEAISELARPLETRVDL